MEDLKPIKTHFAFKAWLILLIVFGIFKVLALIFSFLKTPPENYEIFVLLSNFAIVICFIMLYRLKKWAFWGVAFISLYSLAICFALGFGKVQIAFIAGTFAILLVVMQLKKNNVSAWQALR